MTLDASPGNVIVRYLGERLLCPSCQIQRRVDGPGGSLIGDRKIRESRNQQTAVGEVLKPLDSLCAGGGALVQQPFCTLCLSAGDGACLAGFRELGLTDAFSAVSAFHFVRRGSELQAEGFDFRADGALEDVVARLGLLCPLVGTGQLFFPFHHSAARFFLPLQLLEMIRSGAAPFTRGLRHLLMGIGEPVQCLRHGRQVVECARQLKVSGVAFHGVACCL